MNTTNYYILIFILSVTIVTTLLDIKISINKPVEIAKEQNNELETIPLSLCESCKVFAKSFNWAMKHTQDQEYKVLSPEGKWEKATLKSGLRNPDRLLSVLEALCLNLEEGVEQCIAVRTMFLSEIYDWWEHHQDMDFFEYFCVDAIMYCCPQKQYGVDCKACPGYPDNVCFKNGRCNGEGTREGDGGCTCDKGYLAPFCDKCDDDYFLDPREKTNVLCTPCHRACNTCNGLGAKSCIKCAWGWTEAYGGGCKDINECEYAAPCKSQQYCTNVEASYNCDECDIACNECTGDGPENCKKCAKGYIWRNYKCVDAELVNRKRALHYITRFSTYIGWCIATCIIFNRKSVLFSIVGVLVIVYSIYCEYHILYKKIPPNQLTS